MRIPQICAAVVVGSTLVLAGCGSDDLAATGEFGDEPEVTVPDSDPPDELVIDVLSEGEGEEVEAGDFLVVNYLGQTWEPRSPDDEPSEQAEDPEASETPDSEPSAPVEPKTSESAAPEASETPDDAGEPVPFIFDNSYERGEPAGFPIGLGAVVPGWDEGLVGQTVGSRVLLTIPPDDGFGAVPEHELAADTLVFVVDIIDAFGADSPISGEPVEDLPDDVPAITGEGAEEPTVEITDVEPVEESTSDLLVAGDGAELGDTLVVKVLEVSYETGETSYSSWEDGVVAVPAGQLPGLGDALAGQKVGSRALVRVAAEDNPTEENPDGEPIAIVLDVVGSF